MVTQKHFRENLRELQQRIKNACERYERDPSKVQLMPVTKTHPVAAALWAAEAGLVRVGENRVQEAAGKRPENGGGVVWDLIGPLQSNKTKLALSVFDRIQTVDRPKLVRAIDRLAGELGKAPYPVLLQVNVGRDPAKQGCSAEEARPLLEAIMKTEHVAAEGLMTIGALSTEEAEVRSTFAALRELREELEGEAGCSLPELSMGMTGDLEWAIAEGSTLVRVGTALFGERGRRADT